jgi:esterase/lipase superfamily enzyme
MSGAVVTVYFATNRNRLPAGDATFFGPAFNAGGSAGLRFGKASVRVSGVRGGGATGPLRGVAAPVQLADVTVAEEVLEADEVKLGSEEIIKEMQCSGAAGAVEQRTVVFIHGFNTSFVDGLASAAVVHWNLRQHNGDEFADHTRVALFSWPSDGELVRVAGGQPGVRIGAYYSDRIDAAASGAAFARAVDALMALVARQAQEGAPTCGQKLYMVAHSMGNFVLRHGLQWMLESREEVRRVFEHVALVAADEDDDAFERSDKLALLPKLARLMTVYQNPKDLALDISDNVKFQRSRLGHDGPLNPAKLPRGVVVVDVDKVVTGVGLQHSYYSDAPVAKDLAANVLGGTADSTLRKDLGNNRYELVGPDA